MRFMLMMSAPYGTGDWDILTQWKPDALQAHMRFMQALNADLRQEGAFVDGQGLTPPAQARIVRARDDGSPEVTDGPFAESKEFLAGYWIIDVEGPERAYEIAARISTAPGPDGKPMKMDVELRPVYFTVSPNPAG